MEYFAHQTAVIDDGCKLEKMSEYGIFPILWKAQF